MSKQNYLERVLLTPSPKFEAGQLVRFNHGSVIVEVSRDRLDDGSLQLRTVPITNIYSGTVSVSTTHTVGMVLYTELSQEELNSLKRCGYFPLVQEIIVAIMGDKMVYVQSKMLLPI